MFRPVWAIPRFVFVFVCVAASLSACALPNNPISLREALKLAEERNPSVAAARLRWLAAVRQAAVAGAPANPDLEFSPPLFGEGGSDADATFVQSLELNGARTARSRQGRAEADAARWSAEEKKREVARQVAFSYWDLAASIELARIQEANADFAKTVHDAVRKQVDVGAAPGARLIKAELELIQARRLSDKARLDVLAAETTLNGLLGHEAETHPVPTDTFADFAGSFDAGMQSAKAVDSRPEVKAAAALIEAAQHASDAARARSLPDFAIQFRKGVESDTPGAALIVSLPIFDWGANRSERKAAAADVAARKKELEAARALVVSEARLAGVELEAAARTVTAFRGGLLAKAQQIAELARKGFDSGATSYLEVLEAQRTLRDVNAAFIEARRDLAKAGVQLRWATGADLAEEAKQ